MPWTLLAMKSSSSQASTFWYMVSTMASSSRLTPFRPVRTWSAGRDRRTLGVAISVALRISVVRLVPVRAET